MMDFNDPTGLKISYDLSDQGFIKKGVLRPGFDDENTCPGRKKP